MCLLVAIYKSSLEKDLFRSFVYFLNWVICLFISHNYFFDVTSNLHIGIKHCNLRIIEFLGWTEF